MKCCGLDLGQTHGICQITLIVINILICIGSILLLVLGGLTLSKDSFPAPPLDKTIYHWGAIILIVGGSCLFFLSILGCVAAFKSNKKLLFAYFIVAIVLFILIFIGGVFSFVYNASETSVRQEMLKTMGNYKLDDDEDSATKYWDRLQREYECCGVDSRYDWLNFTVEGFSLDQRYPITCCIIDSDNNKPANCQDKDNTAVVYDKGCFPFARDSMVVMGNHLGGTGIAVAIVLILGMVVSAILCKDRGYRVP